MYKVEGEDGLFRDPSTGAIINKDTKTFEQVKTARLRQSLQDNELKNLKDEISELKSMLHAIINRSDNS